MSRFVVLVLAVVVFFWLLRRALGSRRRDDPHSGGSKEDADAVPDLVSCARCGVLVPRDLAFVDENAGFPATGRHYCSEEHRRLGPG